MKILHTSDWHIGHKLYNNDRTDEHQRFFNRLTQTINSDGIDVLLVSGDIFDVGYPSNMALRTYYGFLKSLVGSRCSKVIITGGNHDFVSTLEAPREVLEVLNVTVVGGVPEILQDEIIELDNEHGDTEVVIAAVPYLREKDIRTPVSGESSEERIRATREGIVQHYFNIAEITEKYRGQNIPVIATGHLYMQGSQLSESERDIHLGNQAGVEASRFPDSFAYFALGHIHRAQTISKSPPVVYSGSPLPLSFSEQNDHKSVRIITVENGKLSYEKKEVPQSRKLKRFEGKFDEILSKVRDYQGELELPDWLELCITEDAYDPLLARAVDQFVDEMNGSHHHFEIIRHTIKFAGLSPEQQLLGESRKSLNEMTETEVFENLLDRQGVPDKNELIRTFKELTDIVYSTENPTRS